MESVRDRRVEILAAATEEFNRHGFAGARVQRIAERAGVNKQLLFYYFGSKARLYGAVVAQSKQQLGDRPMTTEGSSRAILRNEVVATYDALAARPHLTKLFTFDRGVTEQATELAAITVGQLLARFADTISDGQRLGYFRDKTDPSTAARHALGLILGHLMLERVYGRESAGFGRAELCDGIVQVLLRSLEW